MLLEVLKERGEQILHLEQLARHKAETRLEHMLMNTTHARDSEEKLTNMTNDSEYSRSLR